MLWKKFIHSFLFIINLCTTNLCSIGTDTGTRGHGDMGTQDMRTQVHEDMDLYII